MFAQNFPAQGTYQSPTPLYKGFVPTIQGLESAMYLPISELDAARNAAQGTARNSLAYPVTQGFSQLNFAVYPSYNKP